MKWRWLLLGSLAALSCGDGSCDGSCLSPAGSPASEPPGPSDAELRWNQRSGTYNPPPREPGPPRAETPAQLQAAAQEAHQLLNSLVAGGIAPREAASVADMRGYRLYRRRLFGQALAWFEQGIRQDPSFELSLYNAARCAYLLGQKQRAQRFLDQLAALDTPLARSRLQMAQTDPDLIQ